MSWRGKTEEKRRLQKLYKDSGAMHWSGPVYKDEDRGVLKKWYPYSTNHDNIKKYWKTHTSRLVRRRINGRREEDEERMNRNGHKKIFDLWWTLF